MKMKKLLVMVTWNKELNPRIDAWIVVGTVLTVFILSIIYAERIIGF